MLKTNTIISFMIHAMALKLAYLAIEEDNAKEWRRDTQKQLFSLGINSVSRLLVHIPILNEEIKRRGKGNMFSKSTLELFIKLGVNRLIKKNQPTFFLDEENIKDVILDTARKLNKSRKWAEEIIMELKNIEIKTFREYVINFYNINSKLNEANLIPLDNEE